ncbi:MAG: hemolysin family protein [Planctomycetota bacterium]|nr:hemolysin family protein [Planctomycetota bacterium]
MNDSKTMLLVLIISVSVVIVASALCSLCEAVLYSVPLSHVETLAEKGRRSGHLLKALRGDVDRPIAAILSLNTIANTAGAAVAGAAAAYVFTDYVYAVPIFSALLTLTILIFSEIIPKTIGVVYSRQLSGILAFPIHYLCLIMSPFIWMAQLVTRIIASKHKEAVSDEELKAMTRIGKESGSIEEDEAEVIENILELDQKSAREIMTPRSVMFELEARATVAEAREMEGMSTYSRIPIYDENPEDVIGMVMRRDILSSVADDLDDQKVEQLMRPIHFVADSTPLDDLLQLFLDRRQHLFIAVGEHGGVAGLVTLEDVLEEILGREIVDESDEVEDLRELARRRREEFMDSQN